MVEYETDITIIGGGVSGLGSAYWLSQRYADKEIFVLEKNQFIGDEQSGHNSGVDHSHYQYPAGSLKSTLRGAGKSTLKGFCEENDIPYQTTGKLIVAVDNDEKLRLDQYFNNALEAGITIEKWDSAQIREREPNVEAVAALYTPNTGVVDAATYSKTLAKIVESKNGVVMKQAEVVNIIPELDGFVIKVRQQGHEEYEFRTKLLINAAGLFADNIARMFNPEFPYTIRPLRGEYLSFNKKSRLELATTGMVYPVPQIITGMYNQWGKPKTAAGTHLTATFEERDGKVVIGNRVLVGPLHSVVTDKSHYGTITRRPEEFLEHLGRWFPHLTIDDLVQDQVGVQVKVPGFDDYIIKADEKFPNAIHFIADSPGMSHSLDTSRYVVDVLLKGHPVLGKIL